MYNEIIPITVEEKNPNTIRTMMAWMTSVDASKSSTLMISSWKSFWIGSQNILNRVKLLERDLMTSFNLKLGITMESEADIA